MAFETDDTISIFKVTHMISLEFAEISSTIIGAYSIAIHILGNTNTTDIAA